MIETNDNILEDIGNRISLLAKEKSLSFDEVISLLKEQEEKRKSVPVSIFNNDSLSALESIVKYLKEELGLNYGKIASLLSRNYAPIAITYRKAKKKLSERLDASSENSIPLRIFSDKSLSVLEAIVSYLKQKMNLTYHQIAIMLQRNDRTIWTVYQRAIKKRWS